MVAPANPKTWRSSLFATISSAEGAGGLAGLSAEEGEMMRIVISCWDRNSARSAVVIVKSRHEAKTSGCDG